MDEKREFYPLIVLGATFAGIGAAYSDRNNTLIIERTSLVGYEFINAFRTGENWNDVPLSREGKQLKQGLLQRNILSAQGEVHIPAVGPFLYDNIRKDSIHVFLMAEVVDITRNTDCYCVQVYTASGFKKFFAKSVLDTRTESLPCEFIKSKSINAMLYSEEAGDINNLVSDGAVEFIKGKQKGEMIVRLSIDAEDDWITAREKLHILWMNRPEAWRAWKIMAVSGVFDIRANKGPVFITDGWQLLPSSAYRNPLEAFEAGLAYGRKEA